jgi:hypothetical protein
MRLRVGLGKQRPIHNHHNRGSTIVLAGVLTKRWRKLYDRCVHRRCGKGNSDGKLICFETGVRSKRLSCVVAFSCVRERRRLTSTRCTTHGLGCIRANRDENGADGHTVSCYRGALRLDLDV